MQIYTPRENFRWATFYLVFKIGTNIRCQRIQSRPCGIRGEGKIGIFTPGKTLNFRCTWLIVMQMYTPHSF